MRSQLPSQRQFLTKKVAIPAHAHTSIRRKIIRQSLLMVSFCILLLGGLSFYITTTIQETIPADSGGALLELRVLGFTVLSLSGLLLIFAMLLATLLARGLTRPLLDLAGKVRGLQPGTWIFSRTVRTGDEVEMLDHVVDDLTGRLRDAYEYLEDQVRERTRQLQEESALDRAILQSIEYGILAMDKSGVITDANPAACLLLQYSREELIGIHGVTVLPLLRRQRESLGGEHPISKALEHCTSYRSRPSQHISILRRDQKILPINLHVVPLLRETTCFGAIAVFQDQTLERQIDYMKSEFISLASHQLRTPLSAIRWYIEMMNNDVAALSQEHQSYLVEVDTAAKRMANLIDALLHVARLEDGALTPNRQRTEMLPFFERLIEGWKLTMDKAQAALTSALPKSLPSVLTDPVLLEIVLQNLFTNALKYSPENKAIHLEVTADADAIHITLHDHGLGIPQTEQKRIFQKFFRAKNVREIDTDGTGLGLYMSKTIIDNLRGTLSFESVEGRGTAFTVSLPLRYDGAQA